MCIIFVKSFFAISLQHGTVMYIYPSMDAAVCLEIETLLAYDRVLGKCFWGPGKSWIFCNQESGNPDGRFFRGWEGVRERRPLRCVLSSKFFDYLCVGYAGIQQHDGCNAS